METKLTLFHGSNCNFDTVDLSKAKDMRDFGKGFYMTPMQTKAMYWAEFLFALLSGDGIYVYEYEFEMTTDLRVKQFDGISEDWLVFIRDNRIKNGIQHDFDMVQGYVAYNNEPSVALALFIGGISTLEDTLKKLHPGKMDGQISIHTEKALSCLKLINKIHLN